MAVDPASSSEPVRAFDGFTRDLQAMADWLSSCGVTKVAMESTSVYWIPVYEVLERAGFEVLLVPPRMTKQIAGRKSDVLDCQWIWQLLSYGLLRGAFRPGDAVCPLRSYVRQMKRLTEDRSRCVQHMQKALTEMNVQLDSVIADITGQTGMKILRAIIDGERDPERLASFRHRRIKASAGTIAASLEGTWREEHLFALEQAMQRYDFLDRQIEDCEARIAAQIDDLTPPPDGPADDDPPLETPRPGAGDPMTDKALTVVLTGMMGVDLTAIPTIGPGTVLTIASEIGPDFSAFPSAQHYCSWLGVAPGRAHKAVNLVGYSSVSAPPLTAIEDVPDGEIYVDFAPSEADWNLREGAQYRPGSAAIAQLDPILEFNTAEQRWEYKIMRAGHVWFDAERLRNAGPSRSACTHTGASRHEYGRACTQHSGGRPFPVFGGRGVPLSMQVPSSDKASS